MPKNRGTSIIQTTITPKEVSKEGRPKDVPEVMKATSSSEQGKKPHDVIAEPSEAIGPRESHR